jgi:GTP-binding protein YchF
VKIGIVGLPGCGKSTLFQLLAGEGGAPEPGGGNKPRLRTVKVKDPRLERLRDDFQPKKYTPVSLEILDFPAPVLEKEDRAGLADLLAPAREMDVLLVTVRAFRNPAAAGGEAPEPLREWSEVRSELILTDLVSVERRLEKLHEKSRKPSFSDDERREQDLLQGVRAGLEGERGISDLGLGAEETRRLGGFGFLSGKPRVVVLSTEGPPPGEVLERLRALSGSDVLAVAARAELEIQELPDDERQPFLEEYGIGKPQGELVLAAAYRAAGRITFLTAGDKEVRAWSIRRGDTAPQAAGAIHTDFQRGFIRAEVVSFEDYERYGGLKGAKEKGHLRLEGKDYVVQDGDIIEFRFSV